MIEVGTRVRFRETEKSQVYGHQGGTVTDIYGDSYASHSRAVLDDGLVVVVNTDELEEL